MKKLSILLALIMQTVAFSQDWVESYKDQSVSIEFSKITYESPSDGINHERLIFRYTNLTAENFTLSFDRKIAYNGVELPLSDERAFALSIPANTYVEYTEAEKNNKLFYLFVSDNKGTITKKLSDFKFINIETK